ncbi:MAG: alpha/beta hydrolase [Micromonosporaceae bacterium]|nr:alpha/beta hydrolase [Micromonosporaceae bacterium]
MTGSPTQSPITAQPLITAHRHGDHGRQVAVLHGGPGAPGSACSLAQILAEWYTVIEPHQRRAGGEPLTVERHVDDHAALLPQRVAIVGHSWGAMLGLSYAAAHPDRVSALALVGCGSYDRASRAVYRREMARALAGEPARLMRELSERLAASAPGPECDRLFAELGRLVERAQSVDPLPEPEPEPEQRPEPGPALEPRPGPAVACDALGHAQTWEDALLRQADGREPAAFAAISCPVVMFHGRDDPHPGALIRESLQAHLPQLRYVEFPRCGHRPWLERSASQPFVRALRGWLDAGGPL